jgi:Raf kinase inhibitor-like YbhB/YbcL family protein
MLEKLSGEIGRALRGVRAGYQKIVSEDQQFSGAPQTVLLQSPAFQDGGQIPVRYTDDGDGLSPPLRWSGIPAEASSVVVIVEDPDAPTPAPLLHLLAWNLAVGSGGLDEGAFRSPRHAGREGGGGRTAFARVGWRPPGPPRGHGPHLYVFQVFALDRQLACADQPRRSILKELMAGHVLARGVLLGAYERR